MGTKKNTIVSIGFLGIFKCYLNISEDEAKERYKISEGYTDEQLDTLTIKTFEFDEEFGAYDIWGNEY